MNKKFTFKKGIHPPSRKNTGDMEITKFPAGDVVYVPLSQHIGAQASPVVQIGESVLCGTLVGEAAGFMSSNVYSPVSGTVKGFETKRNQTGAPINHIVIGNDRKYIKKYLTPLSDLNPKAVAERLKLAGVVGMGGAAFPTHVKLSPNKKIDTLIINGSECEPYITCDFRMLLEQGEKVIEGAELLSLAVGAGQIYIAIEDNKREAIEHLEKIARGRVKIAAMKTKYPQGAEKQLIYAITGKKVPAGGLPMDVGAVVNNVATAFASWRAVNKGEPLNERVVTVDGDAIEKRGNYLIYTGVTLQDIYNHVRGNKREDELYKVLCGGPMMGFAQPDLNVSVTKSTSAVLFLTEEEAKKNAPTPCINCGKCAIACPMNLMPMYIERGAEQINVKNMIKYGAKACIECGVCSYVCPAKRPLVQSIRLAKQMIREEESKKK